MSIEGPGLPGSAPMEIECLCVLTVNQTMVWMLSNKSRPIKRRFLQEE